MSSGLGQASLFEIGLCIPSTCSSSDLRASLDETVKNYSLASNVLSCDDASHKALSPAEIGVTIMFAIIGLYLLAGTVLDIYQRISCNKQLQGNTRKILIAGSILTNGERILSTKTRKDNIGCLNGIRFITMTWVVLGHVYSFKLISIPAVNPISYIEMVNDWKFMAIVNAVVSVDTFFFLSGLLVTYLLLKELDRNKGRFNIFRFYFHRYIRLTPALALLIAFTTVYMSRLRSGPYYFNLHQFLTKACEDYWWRNLLYINNLFKQEEMCAAHTWYMANDMQMYIISPLFIFPLFMWPVWGVCLAVVGTALSALATVLVMKTYDLPGTTTGYDVMHPLPNTNNFDLFYVKPWMRLGPYLIGILTGYLLHRMKKTGFRFPKGTAVWGWAMATACNLAVLYGIYGYMPLDSPQMPRDLQLTYNALFRIAWACGVAWVVLACAAGSGGSIDALLSWKAFIPLGRLTYSAYLTHVYILPWFWWSTKTSITALQVIDFLATVIIIHATAFILTLIGESPILVLEKTFLFPGESKPATTKQNGAETVHEEGVTEAGIGNEGSVDAEVHEKGLVKDGMDNKGYVDEDRGKTNGFPT
ncbi:unnamed protein product [Darwinula stevensoni]|uniref:Acyltransferase 3 domain-containing protein n=1 Tax=Darwinula stevensoni TaxID=69355 RepID=A0A7R8XIQ5_9CRUS|nr:unnamed protein product [Darwinula stevensoni]CAG0891484.1 unnamed protein product [Darwinula stevensoni]